MTQCVYVAMLSVIICFTCFLKKARVYLRLAVHDGALLSRANDYECLFEVLK